MTPISLCFLFLLEYTKITEYLGKESTLKILKVAIWIKRFSHIHHISNGCHVNDMQFDNDMIFPD